MSWNKMLAQFVLLLALSFSFVSNAPAASCSQSSIDWVNKSYIAYYGRPADPGGLEYWACRLDGAGGDLGSIISAFGASEEFNLRYGSLTNEQLLVNIYQQMFNRDPDPGGKAWYLAKLNSGEMNLQSITLDVLGGATGTDGDIISNKLQVASYFTDEMKSTQATYGNIDAARDILSDVGATSGSRNIAISNCDLLISSWPALVGIPTSITVLDTDDNGNYPVSWGASATSGVSYELEESTDSGFTTGNRIAYTGSSLSAIIESRTAGSTYYYRVKAIKAGMMDSAWETGGNGCTVSSNNGSTEIWSFSSPEINYLSLTFNKTSNGIINVSGALSYYDSDYYVTVTGSPAGTAIVESSSVTMSLSGVLQGSNGLSSLSSHCTLIMAGSFNGGNATVNTASVSCPSAEYYTSSDYIIYGTRTSGNGITP